MEQITNYEDAWADTLTKKELAVCVVVPTGVCLFIYFIYLLGANQKEHTWQMVCKEMRDQCIVERVYLEQKEKDKLNYTQRKAI